MRGELESYGAGLADKSEVIAISRADLIDDDRLTDLKAELEDATGVTPLFVSAPLGEGMETLLDAVIQRLGTVKEAEEEATEEHPWSPL